MSKLLFKWPKRSLWNKESGSIEYVHQSSFSGVATALTKKNQKKLAKVMKSVNIVTSVLAIFKISVSKALNDDEVDEWEFAMLQTLHLEVVNELANVDCKMEAEMRT